MARRLPEVLTEPEVYCQGMVMEDGVCNCKGYVECQDTYQCIFGIRAISIDT